MNTNYFARIMVFGLVFILMAGCRVNPEKFLDDKKTDISSYSKSLDNYKNNHESLSSVNYPDEEMYEVENLIDILREVKRLPNVKDHLEANPGHKLFINFRNGLKVSDTDSIVTTYFYFSMGDMSNLSDSFELVKVLNNIVAFNELMRCPTMCPFHIFNDDYNIPRLIENPKEPKNPDN